MKRTAIIMAGGSGERFWPLSRKKMPKQLLKLSGSDVSMLEESIARIRGIINEQDIFIITSELLLEPIRKYLKTLPPENIIAEPAKRNTAPCLALGTAIIAERYKADGINKNDISIAVLTADHKIEPIAGFHKTVSSALDYVEKNDALCTIGISPDRPATGFGYIEFDDILNDDISRVKAFHEKPELEVAKSYLESGHYLWNSGMFFWRLDHFEKALSKSLPSVGVKIPELQNLYSECHSTALNSFNGSAKELFESFPNESIDYGLMEKAPNVVVAKAQFTWEDIGSWEALIPDKDNFTKGRTLVLDSSGNIIYNASKNNTILTAVGLKDIVLVVTDDAVMACPKERAQDIKEIVSELKSNGLEEYL